MVPSWSTGANTKSSASAMRSTSFPCASFKNSPSWFNSFRAFHCAGLCDAVIMMPPQAFSITTAISVVGVVACPIDTTSNPMPLSVAVTRLSTIGPDMRASRPTTILRCFNVVESFINLAYAAVNFTISSGLSPSPGTPPIVPLIPEIDLTSDIYVFGNCF